MTFRNALIRCTRKDGLAHPSFELVRGDLGLWVRELPENLTGLVEDLQAIRPLLIKLGRGSHDYTLHLSVAARGSLPIVLPEKLMELSEVCGFAIEQLGDCCPDRKPYEDE